MKLQDEGSSSGQAGRGGGKLRVRGKGNPGARGTGNRDTKDSCWYYGVVGHWAQDCRKKKREEGEATTMMRCS